MSVFIIESEKEIEWAAKFYQQEKWLEELDIQKSENAAVAESASRSKIQLEEPDEESQLSSSTPSADGTVDVALSQPFRRGAVSQKSR